MMARKPQYAEGQLPLFMPQSDYVELTKLPDIPAGLDISVDLETRDTGFAEGVGPAWPWLGGHVAGVALSWLGEAVYASVGHPDSHNFELGTVQQWLHETMLRSRSVTFHNAPYDLGWLTTWDFNPADYAIDDTMAMAVMIDENRLSYSLNNLCKDYGIPGKDESKLREAAVTLGLDPKNEMWKMPARYVGGYAAQDARSTLNLRNVLLPLLAEQEVEAAYRLEMDIVPCTVEMRRRGIRVDINAAQRVQNDLRARCYDLLQEMRHIAPAGCEPREGNDFRSPKYLEHLFDEAGIQYNRTLKTQQGQFESKWLRAQTNRIPQIVAAWRSLDDLANKFLGTYILDNCRVGRIHAEIHALRGDDAGTRSYRFSYSNPPLQQMPARNEELAPLVRGVFLSEDGAVWESADYSQQEPRMAVHFAAVAGLPGHEQAVDYYANDPRADFHTMVAEITGLPRSAAKIINLGVMYGMGKDKLAFSLGVSVAEAEAMLAQYHDKMPFVRELSQFCSRRADARGYIKLLDGARCRWDLWQVDRTKALPFNQAAEMQRKGLWRGTLRRAYTHKSMNRLCQGSAARQTKMAMRECWREGIVPAIQMHDELGFANITSEAMGKRVAQIMRECVTLKIPVYVDDEYGISWGDSMKKGANDYNSAAQRLAG